MARSSILDRFRPVGAPGPAGPAGVPTTEERGPAVELLPVFAALAPDVASAREVVEQAQQAATDTLAHAREQASALVAQARLDAQAVRLDTAAQVEKSTAERDRALLGEARTRADDLALSGAAHLPEVVQSVVERILADGHQP